MTFEDYLISKKIDAKAFKAGELTLYENWDLEFMQMHPRSFTAQKLYLINPIRLKYTLTQKFENIKSINKDISGEQEDRSISEISNQTPLEASVGETKPEGIDTKQMQTPKPARPVFKSKPKIN
jgi:hypothetical protein